MQTATLPPGSRFTTPNPLVRRITPGLPVRFDFGVQLPAEGSDTASYLGTTGTVYADLAALAGYVDGVLRDGGERAAQGALDGAVDEILGRHLVDVLALDDREHLSEQLEVLVGGRGVIALAGDRAAQREREDDQERRDRDRLPYLPCGTHGTPRYLTITDSPHAFALRRRPHPRGSSHCVGSWGLPSCRTSK